MARLVRSGKEDTEFLRTVQTVYGQVQQSDPCNVGLCGASGHYLFSGQAFWWVGKGFFAYFVSCTIRTLYGKNTSV